MQIAFIGLGSGALSAGLIHLLFRYVEVFGALLTQRAEPAFPPWYNGLIIGVWLVIPTSTTAMAAYGYRETCERVTHMGAWSIDDSPFTPRTAKVKT